MRERHLCWIMRMDATLLNMVCIESNPNPISPMHLGQFLSAPFIHRVFPPGS